MNKEILEQIRHIRLIHFSLLSATALIAYIVFAATVDVQDLQENSARFKIFLSHIQRQPTLSDLEPVTYSKPHAEFAKSFKSGVQIDNPIATNVLANIQVEQPLSQLFSFLTNTYMVRLTFVDAPLGTNGLGMQNLNLDNIQLTNGQAIVNVYETEVNGSDSTGYTGSNTQTSLVCNALVKDVHLYSKAIDRFPALKKAAKESAETLSQLDERLGNNILD